MFDATMLSRIQFAFTVGYHIIFPAITIGLSLLLLVLEVLWLKTKNKNYISAFRFFAKFFAINFAVGVVTGIPMAFQFGTNWARFTQFAAPAVGPIFAAETLTAFFFEAIFIGIMLFGWKRVHPMVHLLATFLVFVGVHNSAFWIIVINSFMHTPSGVELIDGVLHVVSWKEIIFNPSMPYRMAHMLIASYLTGALLVSAVLSYYLIKKKEVAIASAGFSVAMWFLVIFAPLQVLVGDMHGLNTLQYQPVKVSAMEGAWETQRGVPLILFAIPNQKEEKNYFEIKIPKLTSLILTHSFDGEVKGLKEWKPEDRPNVPLVFFSFRIMVGLGFAYLFIAVLSLYLRFKKNLYESKPFLYFVGVIGWTGPLAVIAGWFVTEIGRQPWIIYNIMRIKDATSLNVTKAQVSFSLIAIIILYVLILIPLYVYVKKLFTKGLESVDLIEVYGEQESKLKR
jgi:cytochrome d ubiquinol oxidase subunit I